MRVSSQDSSSADDNVLAAAKALLASPRDLGVWWSLAEELVNLDENTMAASCYSDLGRAASDLGAVALSVSCVLVLRESGEERLASTLLDRVSKTHCRDSKRVDHAQSQVPPAPPSAGGTGKPLGQQVDAKKSALAAIKAAVKDARARAPKLLPPTPLVHFLGVGDFQALVAVMTRSCYQRGDVVVDLGDEAVALYWISRGGVEVSRDEQLLGELRSDAFFGEIALIGATTRTARVACLEETEVLVIPASAALEFAAKAPSLAKVLASHARSRLLSNVMRTSELFRRLSAEERHSLLPHFQTRLTEPGEVVVTAGQENDSLFVLATGHCEVREGERCISSLAVGSGFGEMSMLGRKPATFDVVATDTALLLSISRDKFDQIASDHPELLAEVYKLLVAREKKNVSGTAECDDVVDAADLVI